MSDEINQSHIPAHVLKPLVSTRRHITNIPQSLKHDTTSIHKETHPPTNHSLSNTNHQVSTRRHITKYTTVLSNTNHQFPQRVHITNIPQSLSQTQTRQCISLRRHITIIPQSLKHKPQVSHHGDTSPTYHSLKTQTTSIHKETYHQHTTVSQTQYHHINKKTHITNIPQSSQTHKPQVFTRRHITNIPQSLKHTTTSIHKETHHQHTLTVLNTNHKYPQGDISPTYHSLKHKTISYSQEIGHITNIPQVSQTQIHKVIHKETHHQHTTVSSNTNQPVIHKESTSPTYHSLSNTNQPLSTRRTHHAQHYHSLANKKHKYSQEDTSTPEHTTVSSNAGANHQTTSIHERRHIHPTYHSLLKHKPSVIHKETHHPKSPQTTNQSVSTRENTSPTYHSLSTQTTKKRLANKTLTSNDTFKETNALNVLFRAEVFKFIYDILDGETQQPLHLVVLLGAEQYLVH
ncbi:uncharacterized protein [Argopecten irradians]|uniref:uncharacterized protein n=1 Tax=Argopecten irradians TaxID=31199 RepID=UPI003721B9AE